MKNCCIIPTYNEAGNVGALIERIFAGSMDIGVLVVDDSSPDGTGEVVRNLQRMHPDLGLLIRPNKEGLGRAYRDAFRRVLADPGLERVIMMDADGSHDPACIPELLRRSGPDTVVVGSRYVRGGRTENWELWRRMLSRAGNAYSRIIAGLPIRDCTSGFMCIPAAYLRRISMERLHASGYAFLIELKYSLLRSGASLVKIPITFMNRSRGSSKISGHIIAEGISAPWFIRLKQLGRR